MRYITAQYNTHKLHCFSHGLLITPAVAEHAGEGPIDGCYFDSSIDGNNALHCSLAFTAQQKDNCVYCSHHQNSAYQ